MFVLQAALISCTLLGATPGGGAATLLEFHSDNCTPCKKMAPVIERLTADGYKVRRVNVDQERGLVERFEVRRVPTFVMVVEGREVDRIVGITTAERLTKLFAEATGDVAQASAQQMAPASRLAKVTRIGPQVGAEASSGDPEQITQTVFNGPAADELANRLVRATVRLRIRDSQGRSTGTGTIIDAREGEALVLTCGHVFRNSNGKGEILVDCFGDNAPRGVPATLVSFDLKADIGLLSLRLDYPVVAARLAASNAKPKKGDTVLSLGCDHGADPSVRRTRVTALNKFLGPDNIEIAGQPVQGRSGGGLFNSAGEVIGVCNAADPADDEGLFAAVSSVHAELSRLGLSDVIARGESLLAQNSPGLSANSVANIAGSPQPLGETVAKSGVASLVPVVADQSMVRTAAFNDGVAPWSSGSAKPASAVMPIGGAPARANDGAWQPKWVRKQF